MTQSTILPLLIPLITAVLSIALRKNRLRDYVSFAGSIAYLITVSVIANTVLTQGAITYQAGGWAAPYGITFVVDALSVFMLLITAIVSLACNLYSWSYIKDKGKESGYYVFLNFMMAGMSGAFTTGDIFNLFVMFEIVLMSSYALISFTGTKESLFTSLKYVVLNLVGSSLMLVAIGGLYSITGTLNMADMAVILSQDAVNTAPVLGLSLILFCVFSIKTGLVPFHFWAPPVYANSPPPASAMMAGISKKVGIYAIIRLYITIFYGANVPQNAALFAGETLSLATGLLLVLLGSATIILGGLSAINRKKLDQVLSYSSVGQIGFIAIPIGFAIIFDSPNALIAALVYLLAHSLAKPALFMMSGLIENVTGTTKIDELGGLSENSFLLAAAFFISAFSLVGIPPLLGFFGKMLVFQTAINQGAYIILVILLGGALTSLIYFSKSWIQVFLGEPVEFDREYLEWRQVIAVMILVVLTICLGFKFELVYQFAEQAATSAFNTENYTQVILGDLK